MNSNNDKFISENSNTFNEYGGFRYREKRKRPLFKENNNIELKQSNRAEVFPTKAFKPDPLYERIHFNNHIEIIEFKEGISQDNKTNEAKSNFT